MQYLTVVLLLPSLLLWAASPAHGFGGGGEHNDVRGLHLRRSGTIGRQHPFSSSQLRSSSNNYNPNDDETPEERKARMDLVRKIQANFYSNNDDDSSIDNDNDDDDDEVHWLQRDPSNPTIINNLPLWRVQWTELPGYQNVLNVHVPHYTHMFRKLVLQHPPPWYFGHVFLHDGSANLNNPKYFLPHTSKTNGTFVKNDEWYAPTTGTLMKITDYTTLEEDGRLVLIVQAVGRIKILEATQHVPYAVANVQLQPDKELWKPNVDKLIQSQSLSKEYDKEFISAIEAACQAVACKEGESLQTLEYLPTYLDKQTLSTTGVLQVSPLSNIDGTSNDENNYLLSNDVFRKRLMDVANEFENADEVLLAASNLQLPYCYDDDDDDDDEEKKKKNDKGVDKDDDSNAQHNKEVVAEWEQKVWIELDRMIQLLETIQPGIKIPVPAQMLGLLPLLSNDDDNTPSLWPPTFRLERYANILERDQVNVGTHSKSPFVRLMKRYPNYPMVRRAGRFSYVVWMLLYTVSFDNQSLTKEEILNMTSVRDRLKGAYGVLQRLNGALLTMYEE